MLRIVHYVNQFFGQVGGEDQADMPPMLKQGPVGPGLAFAEECKDLGQIVGTVICGDNYFAAHPEDAVKKLLEYIRELEPHALIAGPAFNAGRYGPACGALCLAVQQQLHIPVIAGMYPENPGAERYGKEILIARTAASAAGMRPAVSTMSTLLKKMLNGVPVGSAAEEGYLPSGLRKNIWAEQRGAARAVQMLLDILAQKPVNTELPMPVFDHVPPAAPIKDMKKARIALVTEGGFVPKGNPDRLESSRATQYLRYSLAGIRSLSADAYQTVHGGYNNAFVNACPQRLLPLDVLRDMVDEGGIASLADYVFTTTGNGTSYENSRAFGQAIAAALQEDNVQGVILTST